MVDDTTVAHAAPPRLDGIGDTMCVSALLGPSHEAYLIIWYLALPLILVGIGGRYGPFLDGLSDEFPGKGALGFGLRWMWVYLLLIRTPIFLVVALGWKWSVWVSLVYVLGVFLTLVYFHDEGTEFLSLNVEPGEQLIEKYKQKIALLELRQRFHAERRILYHVALFIYAAIVADFAFAMLMPR